MTTQYDAELEALHSRVYPVKVALKQAYQQQAIPKPLYFKGLVQIAYEYAVFGAASECLSVILGIEPEYFRTTSSRHMQEDPSYHEQARVVAETLMVTNLLPTQKVADA